MTAGRCRFAALSVVGTNNLPRFLHRGRLVRPLRCSHGSMSRVRRSAPVSRPCRPPAAFACHPERSAAESKAESARRRLVASPAANLCRLPPLRCRASAPLAVVAASAATPISEPRKVLGMNRMMAAQQRGPTLPTRPENQIKPPKFSCANGPGICDTLALW